MQPVTFLGRASQKSEWEAEGTQGRARNHGKARAVARHNHVANCTHSRVISPTQAFLPTLAHGTKGEGRWNGQRRAPFAILGIILVLARSRALRLFTITG